jgi:hypothetical protein
VICQVSDASSTLPVAGGLDAPGAMPSSLHPQAKFDPIPPDLDLRGLVDRTDNFEWALRVPAARLRTLGPHEFEKLVLIHVMQGGRPLVIEKWNDRLPRDLFSIKWLEETYNKKEENVWDIGNQTNIPMTTGHYIRSMKQLADQWTSTNFRDERRQRLYLKDIDCPVEWHDHLQRVLPRSLFYLNDNVDDRGSARYDDDFEEENMPAPAGDLMSSLPTEMRAQNLMCYIGHEGTYTPAHREMCASLGQNIMVEASKSEDGEKEGSSIWFMTESKDREVVAEFFLSILGHDVEIEKHFAQINAWKRATFPVYIVEQKVGDFILIPPLAPHQVWNRGTRTMKVAWNRTTVDTLALALGEALPKARIVCRDEQYKNKAIVFFTLQKYYNDMQRAQENTQLGFLGLEDDLMRDSVRMRQIADDFKSLFKLFTDILVDEMLSSREKEVEFIEFDSNITCSYCRANIFNRFLTCKHCVRHLITGDEDAYDICMECYAMGRSCVCISGLTWCEQFRWSDLVEYYEAWRTTIIQNDGFVDLNLSPPPLEVARKMTGRKSVAQICQEQLRRRPFKDITKPEEKVDAEQEPSEPEVDGNGNVIKKKRRRKAKKGDVYRCHVCGHKEYTYRLAFCTTPGCHDAYCYGTLYRGFDLMPQAVLSQDKWKCPKCLGICNCGSCRRAGNTDPYVPKNTLLGHDTRRVADDRSVESLINFRLHNLGWLKNVGEESRSQQSKRMQRLRQAADAEKAREGNHLPQESANMSVTAVSSNQEAAVHASSANMPGDDDQLDDERTAAALHPALSQPSGVAEVADMSLSQDVDESSYPDPTGFDNSPAIGPERRLGMGYYQQDDTPDKILFDPYQQPSVEAIAAESGPSEHLAKSLRAAKRRARMETDNDPDFNAPRPSYKKKPRLNSEAEQVIDVDPALLGEDTTTHDDPADRDFAVEDATTTIAEPPVGAPCYKANRPELRHVKPNRSYLEDEDEWEFNDVVVVKEAIHKPNGSGDGGGIDPLDLAASAIRSLERNDGARPPTPAVRRRGRPRKSDSDRQRSTRVTEKTRTPATESAKPRGRASRTSQLASAGLDRDAEPADAEPAEDGTDDDSGERIMIQELEKQLEAELAEAGDEDGGSATVTTPNGAPKKQRGRPPKTQSARHNITGKASVSGFKYMSMADRMALRGKRVKIGQRNGVRGSRSSNQPGPSSLAIVESTDADEVSAGRPELRQIPEPSEPQPSTATKDMPRRDAVSKPTPTVVRLGESDEEDEDPFASSPSVSSSDDDIPATKRGTAIRGRGRGRSRGARAIRGRHL